MEKCKCTKEREIENLNERIRQIELMDVERNKDIDFIKESFKKLNTTLDKIQEAIDEINNKPLAKYEKFIWIVVSSLVAYGIGKFK